VKVVAVKLSKAGAKALKKAGKLKAKLTITLARAGATTVTATKDLTLRAPKKKPKKG
jgi:hypothetical protein